MTINKKTITTEILFLLMVFATSIFYFDIGQWKAYVRLFGVIEILVLITTLLMFCAKISNKSYNSYTSLLSLYGVLSVMQLFPLFVALILGIYYKLVIIHFIIILIGIFNIVGSP